MPLPAGYTQGTRYVIQTEEEAAWLRARRYTIVHWAVGHEIRFQGPDNCRAIMSAFVREFGVATAGFANPEPRPKSKGYYPNVVTPLPLP